MTLEITLRPPLLLPRLLRANKDEKRQWVHWAGKPEETPQKKTEDGKRGDDRRQDDDLGYRSITDIHPGEVKDAFKYFENQLIPAHENWIAENHFCTISLKRIRDGRPSMIFGRIKVCLPSDGHVDNVDELELLFPRKDKEPDRVRIYREDISQHSHSSALSYYLRVRFKASEEDMADFAGADPLFISNGFFPEFEPGFHELLEMNDLNQSTYPWLYVIDSRWFASIPESLYAEIKSKLKEMVGWGKIIINYHPDWLPKEINTLNKVLGYKYEFTPTMLTEPETPHDTAFITAKLFERFFMSPIR